MTNSKELKKRIAEYFTLTTTYWLVYLVLLTPYLILFIGFSQEQYQKWLWSGFCFQIAMGYWIQKLMVRVEPRIRKFYGFWKPCPCCGRG